MKRRSFVQSVLVGFTTVTATGCLEGDGEQNEGNSEESSESQNSDLQYGGTYTSSDGVEITIEKPEKIGSFSANGVLQKPEQGNIFIQINVTARNASDEEEDLPLQMNFELIFQDGQYGTAPFAGLKDDAYQGTDVQPGIVREGSIVFEAPQEADLSEIKIVWSGLWDESATWSDS